MKKVIGTSIFLAAIFFLSTVTAAYLLNGGDLGNSFTAGSNTIDISEDYRPPEELEMGENKFTKRVCVENTGSIPCFVRVFAEFSDSSICDISEISADGRTWYPAAEYKDHLPSGWVYIEEDDELLGQYYYYTEALETGDKTPALFDSVKTVTEKTGQIKDYEIIVYAESVQTLDLEGNEFGGRAWENAWREFLSRR